MKYSVDRIEDEIVIIEDMESGEKKEINISLLPEEVKEGDIIIKEEKYVIDKEETAATKEKIKNRFNSLIK